MTFSSCFRVTMASCLIDMKWSNLFITGLEQTSIAKILEKCLLVKYTKCHGGCTLDTG